MPGRLQNKASPLFRSLQLTLITHRRQQVALVTGAGSYVPRRGDCGNPEANTSVSSGIGLESSVLFASEGANVVLVDINVEAAQKGVQIIEQRYPNVKAVATKADVSKEADVKAAVDLAVKEFGRLDVMFNNAGIMHPADDNALNTEERIWDLTMQINLKGVWWGCKYAILAMRENPTDESKGLKKGGSIINTASFVALMGAATPQLAYTASKGAVLAMTRELAMVHAREGIRLNSICPGPLKTPLLMDFLNTAEKRDRRMVHLPMGRFGEAVEVAKGALFLASEDSSYVTGTDFKVDGGLSSCYVTPIGEPALDPPASLLA
ncbi:short-chain dehydrogenase [Punctularia strigosozonata HHB-11173 SS5]|uniref:short-chain dehydrogenase n=1 Tax=Punctularia strigosozonata (strain HHB-11173) TaxID=741275 RepID=UPI00044182F4|nr:short-chain dehydrogenase [Punctularia strigosozonata HHB-11173 SS5]EIN10394.1 short-chain dehydrogenase [Punctularia strigosozonata HHB-11173 SS5]